MPPARGGDAPKDGAPKDGAPVPGGDPARGGDPAGDAPAPLDCAVARLDLGAFVVGALDEGEAARVRAHVARCPRCRAAYDDLAGLPRLLAHLTTAEAEASGVAAEGAPPARLLATVARRAGTRRRRRPVLAGAAAALLVLAGTLGWAAGDSGNPGDAVRADAPPPAPSGRPPVPGTPPSTPPVTVPQGRLAQTEDPASGRGARLRYAAVPWGSSLDLTLSGIRPGTRCQLDVYGTRGRMETASSWVVPDGGYGPAPGGPGTAGIQGGTSIPVGEITRFVVKTVGDDQELLTIVPSRP